MKEEYLWDKTGADDEEISSLEETLAVFRHQPGEAPRLPIQFQPAPASFSSWRNFSLRFAFAFAAVAIVSVGVWSVLRNDLPAQGVDTVFVAAPIEPEPVFAESEAETDSQAETPVTVPQNAIKVRAVREGRPAVKTFNKAAKKLSTRKPQRLLLTAEEQYAYNEVRKALSISSEKLRIVNDTINGYESTGRKNGR